MEIKVGSRFYYFKTFKVALSKKIGNGLQLGRPEIIEDLIRVNSNKLCQTLIKMRDQLEKLTTNTKRRK